MRSYKDACDARDALVSDCVYDLALAIVNTSARPSDELIERVFGERIGKRIEYDSAVARGREWAHRVGRG